MLDYNSGGREPHIHGDLVDLSEGLSDPRESRWVGPRESDYPGWSPQHSHREKLSHSSRAETLESWRRFPKAWGGSGVQKSQSGRQIQLLKSSWVLPAGGSKLCPHPPL